MKIFLTIFGLVSLALGVLGAFLPVLPTTPFLLLAAALFLRGNPRLHKWLMEHPKLGPYIRNFTEYKAIPMRVKVVSGSLVWITLTFCAVSVAEQWALRALFLVLAVAITVHILSYRTLK